MNRVAIIQARTSSSRLPGKALKLISGVPMIVFMLRRVARATLLDHVMVATSVEESDDSLAAALAQYGYDCFRGDLQDVLGRYASAGVKAGADLVVRLTGDCPLIDAELVDRSITILTEGNYDYVSNVDPPTYPDGLDVEAMTFGALLKAHRDAKVPEDREHVTPFIRRNKALFRQSTFYSSIDLSSLRWTVDYPDDFDHVSAMVDSIDDRDILCADRFDFLRLLESGTLKAPNNKHARNERYDEHAAAATSTETHSKQGSP